MMNETSAPTTPQHDRSGPIDEDPVVAAFAAVGRMWAEAFTAAFDPPEHEPSEDCWCEPEVEHVEPASLFQDDRVIIDARGWGSSCRAVVEVSDPDTAGCVTVRTLDAHGCQEAGRLVTIHPRRLTKADEVPDDEPTVTVTIPGEAEITGCDGLIATVSEYGARLTLTIPEARDLANRLDLATITASEELAW